MKTLFGNARQGWQGEASADPEEVRRRLDMEWGLAQGPITELDCPTGAACHWFSSFTHMAINPDSVLDNLTRLVQVIGPDRQLRQWFSALAEKSAVERRNEIYLACERMQTAGQDADLAVSLRLHRRCQGVHRNGHCSPGV